MPKPFSDHTISRLLARLDREKSFVLLETSKPDRAEAKSLVFLRPTTVLRCAAADDPEAFLRQVEDHLAQGRYAAGWFAYEFGTMIEPALNRLRPQEGKRLVAEIGIFAAPSVYDHALEKFTSGPDVDIGTDTGAIRKAPGQSAISPQARNRSSSAPTSPASRSISLPGTPIRSTTH